jgi:hypothetical protein
MVSKTLKVNTSKEFAHIRDDMLARILKFICGVSFKFYMMTSTIVFIDHDYDLESYKYVAI